MVDGGGRMRKTKKTTETCSMVEGWIAWNTHDLQKRREIEKFSLKVLFPHWGGVQNPTQEGERCRKGRQDGEGKVPTCLAIDGKEELF